MFTLSSPSLILRSLGIARRPWCNVQNIVCIAKKQQCFYTSLFTGWTFKVHYSNKNVQTLLLLFFSRTPMRPFCSFFISINIRMCMYIWGILKNPSADAKTKMTFWLLLLLKSFHFLSHVICTHSTRKNAHFIMQLKRDDSIIKST